MPISGPLPSTMSPLPTMPMPMAGGAPGAPPAPPAYPRMQNLSPEHLQFLLNQGFQDFGDGTMIPPMAGPQTPPHATQSGGPSANYGDIRSNVFQNLYAQGQAQGNQALMGLAQPPSPAMPPMANAMPVSGEPARKIGPLAPAQPPIPPRSQWPLHLQVGNPGARPMPGRFPRPTSLMAGGMKALAQQRGY